MPFTQALFSFNGRLGRLAFFGYVVLMYVIFGLIATVGFGIIGSGNNALGGLMVGLGFIAFLWMDLAVVVKRLHDLNLPGVHLLWISAPSVVATCVASSNGSLAAICWVAHFLIGLWMTFAPGTLGPNRFGERPGTVAAVPPGAAVS
jgi:uncharacterized membrane protein YhaH (DUF805 family)